MSKKTETVELRISPELKTRLQRVSADQGVSMSQHIRQLVTRDLADLSNPSERSTKMSRFTFIPAKASLAALPVAALAAVYLVAAQAPAAASPEARMMFAELDANNDGIITKAEFDAGMAFPEHEAAGEDVAATTEKLPEACLALENLSSDADEMTHFDANADGKITYSELEGVLMREQLEVFLQLDKDRNGMLNVEELTGDMLELTGLSSEEQEAITACEAAMMADGSLGEMSEDDGLFDAAVDPKMMIAEFDANRDGLISVEEFVAN